MTTAMPSDFQAHPEAALTDAARWTAVQARDRRFDGRFVYAVSTTGIYCRPSCPARRPLRDHVAFFDAPDAAERAGYRACRRCRPAHGHPPAEAAVARARAFLDARPDTPVTLDALAAEVGMSPAHLQRTFKRFVGLSPRDYQAAQRMDAFKARVQAGDTVLEAAFEAGFGSSRSLYEQADAGLGMTPGAYRRGGRGLTVRYATAAVPQGRLLVAATDRGVCAVTLGDDDATLEEALAREFPEADRHRDDDAVADWMAPIVRYLEDARVHPDVPVDLHGTDFQQRVWQALQEIPLGETRTYEDVAEALGQPTATRAVASACARNRVALVVPCHRVVRKDGGLGGYRWGVSRKQHLLRQERATGGSAPAPGRLFGLVLALFLLAGCAATTPPAQTPSPRRAITTDAAPRAIGPYSQAILVGNTLYCAGQIGLDPDTAQLVAGGIEAETRRAMDNLAAVLDAAGFTMDDVVQAQVFLADLGDFAAMNAVYGTYFGDAPPARATVQVARLPRDARVEILLTAAR